MNTERVANDIITYIRQNIVPIVAEQEDPPTLDQVWRFRSQLHGLDLLIIQTDLSVNLARMVESMLCTSEALWNLIAKNEETVTNLKEYSRVRSLAAEARPPRRDKSRMATTAYVWCQAWPNGSRQGGLWRVLPQHIADARARRSRRRARPLRVHPIPREAPATDRGSSLASSARS